MDNKQLIKDDICLLSVHVLIMAYAGRHKIQESAL
jgi:hypothetical protein